MHFKWENDYEMGIDVIDKQHNYFVGIINELYDAILDMQTEEKLEEILEKLVNYANEHFSTEEKYFDKFNYDGSDEHKEKHREMRERIADFQNKLNQDKAGISFELVDFLEEWLKDHLIKMDFKYRECFKENGL